MKRGDYLSELEQGLKNLGQLPVLLANGDMDNGIKAGFDRRLNNKCNRLAERYCELSILNVYIK
jgi:hypothetical protein